MKIPSNSLLLPTLLACASGAEAQGLRGSGGGRELVNHRFFHHASQRVLTTASTLGSTLKDVLRLLGPDSEGEGGIDWWDPHMPNITPPPTDVPTPQPTTNNTANATAAPTPAETPNEAPDFPTGGRRLQEDDLITGAGPRLLQIPSTTNIGNDFPSAHVPHEVDPGVPPTSGNPFATPPLDIPAPTEASPGTPPVQPPPPPDQSATPPAQPPAPTDPNAAPPAQPPAPSDPNAAPPAQPLVPTDPNAVPPAEPPAPADAASQPPPAAPAASRALQEPREAGTAAKPVQDPATAAAEDTELPMDGIPQGVVVVTPGSTLPDGQEWSQEEQQTDTPGATLAPSAETNTVTADKPTEAPSTPTKTSSKLRGTGL